LPVPEKAQVLKKDMAQYTGPEKPVVLKKALLREITQVQK
jgi:hypothetical protein